MQKPRSRSIALENLMIKESAMIDKINLNGVLLTLAHPDTHEFHWLDYNDYPRQVEAAWLWLADDDVPLNPRLVGGPGVGKTTLACVAARATGREVFVFQCTTDTRPEDPVITPVLAGAKQIEYRASAVVTAMIRGGAAILDEANPHAGTKLGLARASNGRPQIYRK